MEFGEYAHIAKAAYRQNVQPVSLSDKIIGYALQGIGWGAKFWADSDQVINEIGDAMIERGKQLTSSSKHSDHESSQYYDNNPVVDDTKTQAQIAVYDYRKLLVGKRDYDNDSDTFDLFTIIANRNELAKTIKDQYPTVTRHSSLDSFATSMRESNFEFFADEIIALICYFRTI